MQSLWNDKDAPPASDVLALRVYTSRLLGSVAELTLHGGGNTSVKHPVTNLFGETEDILYVKGSGWDLATIEAKGFAPCKMEVLLKLAEIPSLSDSVIVTEQRKAMIDPNAPNPSVEAILHALIPFKYVDHTHADALVTLTNTPEGDKWIKEVYGDRLLIIPYIMPGFLLMRGIHERTRGLDWGKYDGMVLLNHGLFTFANDARSAYEMHIKLVTEAEDFLKAKGAWDAPARADAKPVDLLKLSRLRKVVSDAAGKPMIAKLDTSPEAVGYACLENVADIATRGLLTPDHVIRTKRIPAVIKDDIEAGVKQYVEDYIAYFNRYTDGSLTMIDPAPRSVVWVGVGTLGIGESVKTANMATDVNRHTRRAVQWAEAFSKWQVLSEKDIFDIEYWELEQVKLKLLGTPPQFQGKIALVTGAASGIGRASAQALSAKGAAVMGVDIEPRIAEEFKSPTLKGMVADLTDEKAMLAAVEATVREFGGLDILVLNAGIFPISQTIEEMDRETWDRSLAINLTSQQRLLQACIPYLRNGVDPSVVIIASRNATAPGPGVGAYSVSKAGVTQLGRVAALELAQHGIRVNMLHPDGVFDTGIWTPEVLQKRAAHYGMTVEQYKRKNLLGVEIYSKDVAELVCALASPLFSKTTGAQIPIDGGNERVI